MFAALPSRRTVLTAAIAVFGLLLAVYGKSLWNDFVRWDDGLLIFENTAVRTPSLRSLRTFFTTYDPELYIPLTFVTYQLTYLLSGVHAFGYHLVSILFHGGNVLLVLWLAALLTRRAWAGCIAAALFAVHPLHVETVAWASALKDLQSTFFLLLTLIAYVYYRESGSRRTYWLGVGFFVLGLLSKVVVLTVPAVLLLLDWRDGRKLDRAMLLEKLPHLILSVAFLIIALVGKADTSAAMPIVARGLLAAKSTAYLLWKFVLPFPLPSMYPYARPVSLASPDIAASVAALAVLTAAVLWSMRRTREAAFGAAFFLVTLAPWFYTFKKGEDVYFASDRFLYVPSIGLVVLIGSLLARWMECGRNRQRAGAAMTAAALVALSALTLRQSLVWRDTRSLFSHFARLVPDSYVARNNLGNAYRREGSLEDAIAEFEAALRLKENRKSYANLGAVYAKLGDEERAVRAFTRAAEIDPASPEPHVGFGILYATLGRPAEALASYARAIELNPRYAQAYLNRGSVRAEMGDAEGAIEDFRQAVALEPLFAQAHYNLAVLEARRGELAAAISGYERTVALQPSFIQARLNLGILYAKEGRRDDASEQFRAVLTYQPENAAAFSALGQLEAAGR